MDPKYITRCRSCGEPIIWAQYELSQRPAPINATPDPHGNIHLYEIRPGLVGYSIPPEAGKIQPLYTNHFMTCRFAARHKKRNAPPKGGDAA